MTNYAIPTTTKAFIDYAALIGEYVTDPRSMVILTNSVVDLTNEFVSSAVDDALDSAESPFRRIMDEQAMEINTLHDEIADLREQLSVRQAVSFANQQADKARAIEWAKQSREVMGYLDDDKKILAIKLVRQETGVGLKAAKDAVESREVQEVLNLDCWCEDCR